MIELVMTAEEYQEHVDSSDGVCLNCGEIAYGCCEPDAENYPCDECGKARVIGIELALVAGDIIIEDE